MHHSRKKERALFLKRFLKSPKGLGAIIPSSQRLARSIATHVSLSKDSLIVEIGAGTGSLTRGLLNAGYTNVVVVEIDKTLCNYLREHFPQLTVIQADACHLHDVLPKAWINRVDAVVSGLPMVNFSKECQKSIIDSCFSIMHQEGCFVQFTYGFLSPLPFKKMGLVADRLDYVFFNVPPAIVWRYRRFPSLETSLPLYKKDNIFLEHMKKWQRRFSKKDLGDVLH